MTTPERRLAVVRLYQPEPTGDLRQQLDLNLQVRHCGDEENRTLNPRLAKAVLCQLSYVPWLNRPEPIQGKLTRRTGIPRCRRLAGGLVPERGLGSGGLATALDEDGRSRSDTEQQQDLLHQHHPVRDLGRLLGPTVSQRTHRGISDHKPWA